MSKIITTKEVKELLLSKGYIPLFKEYVNTKEKLPCKTREGYKVYISLPDFKRGKEPSIFRKSNPYTIHNIKNYIKRKRIQCELLSTTYVNNKATLKFKCKCGKVFEKSWNNFSGGQTECNACRGKIFWNNEKIINFIERNSECKVLFIGRTSKKYKADIKLKCFCGNIFKTTFNQFHGNNKRQCNKCSIANMPQCKAKDKDVFIDEVSSLVSDKYSVLSEYVKSSLPVTFIHHKCGNKFDMRPNDFLRGQRCPRCFGTPRKTTAEFQKEVFKKHKKEYSVVGEYKNNRTKITIKHNKCEYKWDITPDAFLNQSQGCPKCIESKGERSISKWLYNNNFTYKEQFKFKKCKNERPLPFDFYLPDYNICIEYDGEFHFKETTLGNDLKQQKKHDKIKNEFCKENNIKLIRIPYWEFDNIETILESVLP